MTLNGFPRIIKAMCILAVCLLCLPSMKYTWCADDAAKTDTTAKEPAKPLTPEEQKVREAALAEGQALFRGLCSGCHGGAGRGGKGPDLTDTRWIHGDKDSDIAKVIRE